VNSPAPAAIYVSSIDGLKTPWCSQPSWPRTPGKAHNAESDVLSHFGRVHGSAVRLWTSASVQRAWSWNYGSEVE